MATADLQIAVGVVLLAVLMGFIVLKWRK